MDNDLQQDEWEGGPLEGEPADSPEAAPIDHEQDGGLDERLAELSDEPDSAEPEIAEEGPPPIPELNPEEPPKEPTEIDQPDSLDERLGELDANEPFEFAKGSSGPPGDSLEPETPDIDLPEDSSGGAVDDALGVPDTLTDFLREKGSAAIPKLPAGLGSNSDQYNAFQPMDSLIDANTAIASQVTDQGRRIEDIMAGLERARL